MAQTETIARLTGPVARARHTVRVVASDAGFDALERDWQNLHAESGATVFQSYEWLRTWWRHFGRGRKTLLILVVSAGGRAVGIAPFFIETLTVAGLPALRRLSPLGRGSSDYLDVLAIPDERAEVLGEFARSLWEGRSGFDLMVLEDISERSPNRLALFAALTGAGFSGDQQIGEYCPRTALADSWEATQAAFPAAHRSQLKKKRKQLAERFAIEFELVTRAEEVPAAVDEFIDLHTRRWQGAGQGGVFADPRAAGFQRAVAPLLHARGWLFLAFLKINGKRAVAECCFRSGRELLYYLNGIGEVGEAMKQSPGLVQHSFCMEAAIAEGLKVYDFLRGTERYKYELGGVDVPNWTMTLHAPEAASARRRYRVLLLKEALGRRARHEVSLLDHQRRESGLFSRGMFNHVAQRAKTVVKDTVQKAKAPEKSVAAAERGNKA